VRTGVPRPNVLAQGHDDTPDLATHTGDDVHGPGPRSTSDDPGSVDPLTGPPLDARLMMRALAAVSVLLVLASVVFAGLANAVPGDSIPARALRGLHHFTFTDREHNLFAWFSTLLLALLALALAGHAFAHRRAGRPFLAYAGLALVALYMSLDEDVSLHEKLAGLVPEHRSTFQWLVVGLPLAVVAGLVVLWVARGIDPSLRRQLVVAGLVYLSGAAVTEGIEAMVVLAQPDKAEALASFGYAVATALEEGLEVAGVLLALRVLLLRLPVRVGPAR
jgi:hypothetical protein